MLELEPREKLCKLKLQSELIKSANRIVDQHLDRADTIQEIQTTNIVYEMGQTIEIKIRTAQKQEKNVTRKKFNRKHAGKETEYWVEGTKVKIARASNEIYRMRKEKKVKAKEKTLSNSYKQARMEQSKQHQR